jgi:hypothetical protein
VHFGLVYPAEVHSILLRSVGPLAGNPIRLDYLRTASGECSSGYENKGSSMHRMQATQRCIGSTVNTWLRRGSSGWQTSEISWSSGRLARAVQH